jgi:ribosomal protein S18 acetylase RimI-like enzyme
MSDLSSAVLIRPARKEDSAAIAALFRVSSDGLADYIWSRMGNHSGDVASGDVGSGQSLLETGRARYEREGVAFSYQNCLVAEQDGEVIGMIHCFPMEPSPEADPDPDPDPVLAPYAALEDYGSLYISGVALVPEQRGKGIGTQLLAAAEKRARNLGLPRLSLICFEANAAAMRLYHRLGFRAVDRRPLVPHQSLKYRSGDAVLMVRRLD